MPKLRWDCDRRGCFNTVKRPKIEMFDDCFPGAIAFGDVDARVEIGGRFLELEWKPSRSQLSTGQRIAFEQLTANYPHGRYTVVVVVGDAEKMVVEFIAIIRNGAIGAWKDCNLAELKARISAWSDHAAAARRQRQLRSAAALSAR